MLDLSHDFFKSLEVPAEKFTIALRLQVGLDARAHIIESEDGNALLFTTDHTDSQTLRRFLAPILSYAFNDLGSEESEKNICALNPSDHPYHNHDGRGLAKVELCPNMIGYLRARL